VRELINLIPFLDVTIGLLLVFFLYLGWSHGTPRILMVVAAVYTGFLLASIYYHLFAVTLARVFKIQSSFTADLISFLILNVVISVLMLALLLSLFGHIQAKGKIAVFDKMLGSIVGFFTGIVVIGILVTLMRVPHEANTQSANAAADMPPVKVFSQAYEKSVLAPYFLKGAPLLLSSVRPLLPPEIQAKGAVPLLASMTGPR
jgi:uncharacterized membrane protein required for colicin V production